MERDADSVFLAPQPYLQPSAEVVHFAIPDGEIVADDKQLLQLARSLADRCTAGATLYIHCHKGHGRTGKKGLLLVCYPKLAMMHAMMLRMRLVVAGLVSACVHGVLTGDLAPASLRAVSTAHRARRSEPERESPETHAQKMQVHRVLGSL